VNPIFLPLARALGQLNDRVFLGALALSLVLSGLVFFGLHLAAIGVVHFMLELHGWWAWVADILGSVAAMALSLWLFLPLAAMIGTLFIDSIARAVERRWYPGLAPAVGAPILSQIWLGLALGLRILLLNILALLCVLLIPGIGLVLGWAIAAYGLGRGLFMAVALRRMPRGAAEMVYRRARWVVLAQGAAMALAGTVPLLNLLIPVIGTAAMVHVLDRAIGGMRPRVAPVQG
jgi:CysZ protein